MSKSKKRYRERILQALGEAVRIRRRALTLSQEELGVRASLHRTYVTDVENGLRNMSLLTLIKVSYALELPLSQLIVQAENLHDWSADGADKLENDHDK